MKKLLIGIVSIVVIVALAGMYKFNYLANQEGYSIDGNKIPPQDLPQAENCAADGVGCKQFNPDKSTPLSPKKQIIKSVPPEEFKALAKTGEYTIIDVRTPEELLPENGGKIFDEAINIDFYEPDFTQNLMKLDRDEKYLIYCRSGNRSGQTLDIMRKTGFKNVIDLAGGKKAWDSVFSSPSSESVDNTLKSTPANNHNTSRSSRRRSIVTDREVICTQDAKQCPDGSFVSRKGPRCEFEKCPAPNPSKTIGQDSGISLNEVAKHNSKSDCWGAINGKVYDVTAFFGKHPGGDPNLFRICGIDATDAFQAQHGNAKKPNAKLASFYLGDLAQ